MSKIHWFERNCLKDMALTQSDIITGSFLKSLLIAGSRWLNLHVTQLNRLNVFPVPDSDTGTNMTITLKAALTGLSTAGDHHVGLLSREISEKALLGARGNSGVILSQILSGFATALANKQQLSIAEFAEALQAGSDSAYRAVHEPVEGTILTVIREVARAGQQGIEPLTELDHFFGHLLEAGQNALQSTPELLPILKQAQVVDSGGQGLVYLLEGMFRHSSGLPVDRATLTGSDSVNLISAVETSILAEQLPSNATRYGYDVQFLIKGRNLNIDKIRKTMTQLGESVLVVGNEALLKVHVHVDDPGRPLSYGATQGQLVDVVVENMDEQAANRYQPTRLQLGNKIAQTGTIAVVNGLGLGQIVISLGANAVMQFEAETGIDPERLLAVMNGIEAEQLIILPNDKALILTAQQAGLRSSKHVTVLPTKDVPQGISALLSFDPDLDLRQNLRRMTEAMQAVRTLVVTQAKHLTTIVDSPINPGDYVAICNDEVLANDQLLVPVVLKALDRMITDRSEILTIYFGSDIPVAAANELAQEIAGQFPMLEIDVLNGGQPHYPYLISLE